MDVYAGQSVTGGTTDTHGNAPKGVPMRTRAHASTLADRLDVARAAERAAGVAVQCGRIGCTSQASSTVRGIHFCAGHAGFAAVTA